MHSVMSGRPRLSVPAVRMGCMSEHRALRRIGDPVVGAAPAGVRIRTRIHLSPAEADVLAAIGSFLGSVYRTELAARVRLGRLDHKAHAAWRAQRKQALTAVTSSRWAGAITRAVEDQYQLGMRALGAHVRGLRAAVEVLAARCALRPGEPEATAAGARRSRRRRGYRSAGERFAKTRRLAILRERLVLAQEALDAGRPAVTMGGRRLWRDRSHLDEAALTEPQWRARWDGARMFLTADGESGKASGNETVRVDEAGRLRIKVPAALAAHGRTHLDVAVPVAFGHRVPSGLPGSRADARCATTSATTLPVSVGTWTRPGNRTRSPRRVDRRVRTGPVLGVDLNAGHLAACVLDGSGNPVGDPITIPVATAGLAASRRDGRVRAAITTLLDTAAHAGCTAVVIENLDFVEARAVGRDTMGRGKRGKSFRRSVAGIPTAKFRTRLTAMATRRCIAIIGVDPAYTSKWGGQHWAKPLQQQTSEPVTGHHGAATAIGRRGLAQAIRRRPADPAPDRGPLRAHHRPGPNVTRTTLVGTAVPAHPHPHDG